MKEKIDYILRNCEEIESLADVNLMLNALDINEIQELKKCLEKDYYYFNRIERAIDRRLRENPKKEKNKPLSTLLKLFLDKKSKCVVDSRNKLKERFYYVSYSEQRKILGAFLASCASDRKWAYTQLYNDWDSYFETKIKELWENKRELRCEWIVVKYFSEEYLLENLDHFNESSYKYLCVRLAHCEDFVIDRSKLSDYDYIYVAAKSRLKLDGERVLDYLFEYISSYIDKCDEYDFERDMSLRIRAKSPISTNSLGNVGKILWCMSQIGLLEELMCYFEWDNTVRQCYEREVKRMQCEEYSLDVFKKVVKENLSPIIDMKEINIDKNDKRNIGNVEDLIESHPHISSFMQDFELEEVKN